MKVLSLLQPWATLVVMGHKKIETRSWNTKYRGEILIHASKRKITVDECDIEFYNHLFNVIPQEQYSKLHYGAIIGKVEIVGTCSTESFDHHFLLNAAYWGIGNTIDDWFKEKEFGDYSAGRHVYYLKDAIEFKNPVPAKGSLSLWDHPDIHEEEIICPECGLQQWATVEHTFPWATYVHNCIKCKYVIMESEWTKAQ